jgi:hypothetical protein
VLESWEERGLMGIGRGREREASVCLGEFLEGSGVDGLWRMFFLVCEYYKKRKLFGFLALHNPLNSPRIQFFELPQIRGFNSSEK